MKTVLWWEGVTAPRGVVLKGCSIRKVENRWFRDEDTEHLPLKSSTAFTIRVAFEMSLNNTQVYVLSMTPACG